MTKTQALHADQCPGCAHVHLSYADEPCVSCGCDLLFNVLWVLGWRPADVQSASDG